MRVKDLQQGSLEWLEWRQSGFTSTDAEVLLGVSKYKSLDRIWDDKKLAIDLEEVNARMQKKEVAHGSITEEKARVALEKATNIKFNSACIESSEYDFLKTSVDGINYEFNIGIEIKCPYYIQSFAKHKVKIPEYYFAQCQHHMLVTGYNKWVYYSYFGNSEYLEIVKSVPEIQKEIINRALIFKDILKKKRKPKNFDNIFVDFDLNQYYI